jgi:hypothetical protein
MANTVVGNDDERAISLLCRAIVDKIDTTAYTQQQSPDDEQCLTLWGVVKFNHECGRVLNDFLQRHLQTLSSASSFKSSLASSCTCPSSGSCPDFFRLQNEHLDGYGKASTLY